MEFLILYLLIGLIFFFLYCFLLAKYSKVEGKEAKYISAIFLLSFVWPIVIIFTIGFAIMNYFKPKQDSK